MIKIKIKSIKINNYDFKYPIFSSALSGYSDKSYRKILKEKKVPFVFTEMVSAKSLVLNNLKSNKIIDISNEKKPIGIQIFGRDCDFISEAAKIIEEKGADLIDFNMGCPAKKIIKNGEGSALIDEPELAGKILKKLVEAVKIPVTLKIRKGFTNNGLDSLRIIKIAEDVGIKIIFIHGRTAEEYYNGNVDWDFIKNAKDNVKIPIFGNGNITKPEDIFEVFKMSYCDGVLIGRGFLGNPSLYKNFIEFLKTGKYKLLTYEKKIKLILKHLEYIIKDKGENKGIKDIRKFFKYYLKNLPNNSYYRSLLNNSSKKLEIKNILKKIKGEKN